MASDSPSSKVYSADPALYMYTSLTAGSSHIWTATSRLETILRANKIPFKAIDIATDEKARMLWGRRAGKDESGRVRKLPGLVQMGMVLGDLPEIEEWNEYGELKQHVTIYYDEHTQPPISQAPKTPAAGAASTTAAGGKPVVSPPAASPPPPPPPPPPSSATTPPPTTAATDAKKENLPPMAAMGAAAATAAAAAATAAAATGGSTAAMAQRALPIRGIAEEAAEKAKQIRLQSLRDKVYGKGNTSAAEDAKTKTDGADNATDDKGEEKEEGKTKADEEVPAAATDADAAAAAKEPAEGSGEAGVAAEEKAPAETGSAEGTAAVAAGDSAQPPSTPEAKRGSTTQVGLQSPTTGTWKTVATGPGEIGGTEPWTDDVSRTLQSPTSGSWRPMPQPVDVDPPVRSLHGSIVQSASEEEIAAVEKEQAIKEEPEEEEEEEAEETEETKEEPEEHAKADDVDKPAES